VSALVAAMMMTAPADAACLSQGEARRAVASGEALRLSEVRGVVDGDIVKAELCERRGRLVYRLTVIRGGGAVATVVVDAATGEVLR
jgi:uncharacterized membrane protein YkoI